MSAFNPSPSATDAGPDFRSIDTWLFDLDNTLYPPEAGLLHLVEARILEFFVELTGLPPDDAWALQKRYLRDHGAATAGLALHHQTDPHHFMRVVHDVPLDGLKADAELRSALARLPGRRLVFTNGSAWHAERVLKKLGIEDQFDHVFHAEAANLVLKPDPRAFALLIAAHNLEPKRTAFFEDRAVNLEPAAALGMTTVLVHPDADASTELYVQHRTAALAPFLNAVLVMETR